MSGELPDSLNHIFFHKLEVEETENYLFSPIAQALKEQDGFCTDKTVNIFSGKVNSLKLEEQKITTENDTNHDNIFFKSEIPKEDYFITKENKEIQAKFSIILNPKEEEHIFDEYIPQIPRESESVIKFIISDNSTPCIEPILYTAFLMRGSDIVSDTWFFAQSQTKSFFDKANIPLNLNLKAGIIMKTNPEETYLMIFANRVIQVGSGSDVTEYYLKPLPKKKELAVNSVNLTFPRCSEVWTPFAFTFAKISDIISHSEEEGFELPQLFFKESSFKAAEVAELMKKARNKSIKQLPISLHLSASMCELEQPQVIESEGYFLVNAIVFNKISKPLTSFRNEMSVKVVQATLKLPPKVKGRNIVAKISMQNGTHKNGKITRDRFNNVNTDYATTVCFYHEKKPYINDKFLIELPYELDTDASIRIELFHAIAQKSEDQWSEIGWAEQPLFTPNGELIAQGNHEIPVMYNNQVNKVPLEDNHVKISISMKSILFTSNNKLYQFMMKGRENICDETLLQGVEPELILQNLIALLSVCIYSVSTSGVACIKSLEIITKAVSKIFPNYQEFLTDYATRIALQQKPDESYSINLINAYKTLLEVSCFNEGEDIPFVDFLLILITKSLRFSFSSEVSEVLPPFAKVFAKSMFKTLSIGLIQCKRLTLSLARFINMIGSINIEDASKMVDEVFSIYKEFALSQSADNIIFYFLKNSWNPVFFLESISKCDITAKTVIDVLLSAKSNFNSLPIQGIYNIILNNAMIYTEQENELIVEKIIDSLNFLCPASELPFSSGSEIHGALSFLVFILFYIRKEKFIDWWGKFDKKKSLFDSIHFLLDKVSLTNFLKIVSSSSTSAQANLVALEKSYGANKESGTLKRNFRVKRQNMIAAQNTEEDKETTNKLTQQMRGIIYISHIAIINLLDVFIKSPEINDLDEVIFAIYHLTCSDLAVDALPSLTKLLCDMLDCKGVFESRRPPIAKFIARVMELSAIYKDAFAVVDKLFAVDKQSTNNTNRAKAICTRAYPYITIKVNTNAFDNVAGGEWFLNIIKEIQSLSYTGDEQTGDSLYNKAVILKHSPDTMFIALGELADFHHKNGYFAEEIQAHIMRCALILENLVFCGKITTPWNIEHPATLFASICPNYVDVITPFGKGFNIPSFCDSTPFSLTGFIKEIIEVIRVATESEYYEQALLISEFSVPLLEANNMFATAGEIINLVSEAGKKLGELKTNSDRLLGRYYRITFFGKQWGKDNGKCYIYREKKLTNLYTVMGRIRDEFTEKFGACEAIMDSKPVDASKLDPDKAYFQPTSVEALIDKKENNFRKTSYEKGSHLTKFFLDAPFTTNGKAQGTVETQWLRRTILIPEVPMPCATKRVQIKSTRTVEYEPIRVACRQLRERVEMLKTAVRNGEGQTIQQLLSGSLLVQVNEGPSRMAEVFLEDKGTTKYQNMLREIFKDFLAANQEGLKFHANYIINNPMFSMMQHEMEAGFESLSEKLSRFM